MGHISQNLCSIILLFHEQSGCCYPGCVESPKLILSKVNINRLDSWPVLSTGMPKKKETTKPPITYRESGLTRLTRCVCALSSCLCLCVNCRSMILTKSPHLKGHNRISNTTLKVNNTQHTVNVHTHTRATPRKTKSYSRMQWRFSYDRLCACVVLVLWTCVWKCTVYVHRWTLDLNLSCELIDDEILSLLMKHLFSGTLLIKLWREEHNKKFKNHAELPHKYVYLNCFTLN